MSIEQKLLAVITESLPEAHVGVLKDYLTKAAENEKRVKDLTDRLESEKKSLQIQINETQTLRSKLETITKERDELKAREDKVKEEQRVLDLTLAKNELECVRRERDTIIRLNEIVFRNPKFVHREELRTETLEKDQNNSYSSQMNQTKTETVTKTVESGIENQ